MVPTLAVVACEWARRHPPTPKEMDMDRKLIEESGLPARFWSKVDMVAAPNGCWLWTASTDQKGYGMFRVGSRSDGTMRTERAHRVAYVASRGAVPDGMQLDHLCRNPSCVRPDHLEAVTSRENTLRGEGMVADYARRTHCSNGHEFTPENTYARPGRRERICRTCTRRNG